MISVAEDRVFWHNGAMIWSFRLFLQRMWYGLTVCCIRAAVSQSNLFCIALRQLWFHFFPSCCATEFPSQIMCHVTELKAEWSWQMDRLLQRVEKNWPTVLLRSGGSLVINVFAGRSVSVNQIRSHGTQVSFHLDKNYNNLNSSGVHAYPRKLHQCSWLVLVLPRRKIPLNKR